MRKKKKTIIDIAEEAGVSPATVSRVLNRNTRVSPEKTKQVMGVVKKYNYKQDIHAQALLGRSTRTIGFIIPDITNPHYSTLFYEFENIARQNDYKVVLGNSRYSYEYESELMSSYEQMHVDGIILGGGRVDDTLLDEKYLQETISINENIPIIALNHHPNMPGVSQLHVKIKKPINDLVAYLKKMGCREMAIIGGNPDKKANPYDRRHFYLEAARANNIKVKEEWIIPSLFTEADGRRAAVHEYIVTVPVSSNASYESFEIHDNPVDVLEVIEDSVKLWNGTEEIAADKYTVTWTDKPAAGEPRLKVALAEGFDYSVLGDNGLKLTYDAKIKADATDAEIKAAGKIDDSGETKLKNAVQLVLDGGEPSVKKETTVIPPTPEDPDLTKKVKGPQTDASYEDSYAMTTPEDAFTYRVTAKLPADMTGYVNFKVTDQYPKEIALGDVTVTVDDVTSAVLTKDTPEAQALELVVGEETYKFNYQLVKAGETGSEHYELELTCEDAATLKQLAGKTVVIDSAATLNDSDASEAFTNTSEIYRNNSDTAFKQDTADVTPPPEEPTPVTASITLKKVDEMMNPLIGAKFKLAYTGDETKDITDITVGDIGTVTVDGLVPGEYTLTEIAAPEGYVKLEGDLLKVTVDEAGNVTTADNADRVTVTDDAVGIKVITVTNKPIKAYFNKVYLGDTPLTGATFTINDGATVSDLGNGSYEITGLKAGHTYQLKEQTAPDGYILDPAVYEVKVDAESKVTINGESATEAALFTITNYPADKVYVKKLDANTGENLEGAEFKLFKKKEQETPEVTVKLRLGDDVNADDVLNNLTVGLLVSPATEDDPELSEFGRDVFTKDDVGQIQDIRFTENPADKGLAKLNLTIADGSPLAAGHKLVVTSEADNTFTVTVTKETGDNDLGEAIELQDQDAGPTLDELQTSFEEAEAEKQANLDKIADYEVIIDELSQTVETKLAETTPVATNTEAEPTESSAPTEEGNAGSSDEKDPQVTIKASKEEIAILQTRNAELDQEIADLNAQIEDLKAPIAERENKTESAIDQDAILVLGTEETPQTRIAPLGAPAVEAPEGYEEIALTGNQSNKDGMVNLGELENGEYILKEVKPPKGYPEGNKQDIPFEITNEGILYNGKIVEIIIVENSKPDEVAAMTVTKKWQNADGSEAAWPTNVSIEVGIQNNGAPYTTVVLDEENPSKMISVDKAGNYTVSETTINQPAGDKATYTPVGEPEITVDDVTGNITIVLTNKIEPEEPTEPDEPDEPDKPEVTTTQPEETSSTTEPTETTTEPTGPVLITTTTPDSSEPTEPTNPDETSPSESTEPGETTTNPDTTIVPTVPTDTSETTTDGGGGVTTETKPTTQTPGPTTTTGQPITETGENAAPYIAIGTLFLVAGIVLIALRRRNWEQ